MTHNSTTPKLGSADGAKWVSEYTAVKDSLDIILTFAKAKGLIFDDMLAAGSAARFLELSAAEKEALSFERVCELARPSNIHGTHQAETYRAAFKLAGSVVSESTNRRLDHMANPAEYPQQSQKLTDDVVACPNVQETERQVEGFNRNCQRVNM
jgi:hypothetical protein